jgi:hypothetical protein
MQNNQKGCGKKGNILIFFGIQTINCHAKYFTSHDFSIHNPNEERKGLS